MPTSGNNVGAGGPCGACKFLRRKCAADCIFAPYFCSDQGAARFAAIHKVFGASNVSKLLLHVPAPYRFDAAVTIAYEAQARVDDPVHGCVAHIFALQQQVAYLQAQLMQVKAQVAHNLLLPVDSRNYARDQLASWNINNNVFNYPSTNNNFTVNSASENISPQSSIESVDYISNYLSTKEIQRRWQDGVLRNSFTQPGSAKKRPASSDLGELQELALRMMRN